MYLQQRNHTVRSSRGIRHQRPNRKNLHAALSGRQSSPPQEQEPKRPYPHARCNHACRHGDAGVNDEGRINRRSHQSENCGSKTKKRLRSEGGWFRHSIRQQEYQIILELFGEFPVKILCRIRHPEKRLLCERRVL